MIPAIRILLCWTVCCAAGCNLSKTLDQAAKNITLNTPQPIKVDMKITLDVYQHEGADKARAAAKELEDIAEASRRKYNRQAEIQTLKNSRLVAETHQGLLILREQPAGPYGNYVRETVDKENVDRKTIMVENARKQRRELHELEKEHYEENVKNSFAGEWIEVPDSVRPGGWKLAQKP
jgi:Protein of unknown function (DUF1318)